MTEGVLHGDRLSSELTRPATLRVSGETSVRWINAIAIPQIRYGVAYHLTDYFKANVIGGVGAFVIEPAGEHDYAAALRNKFIKEISMAVDHDDRGLSLSVSLTASMHLRFGSSDGPPE